MKGEKVIAVVGGGASGLAAAIEAARTAQGRGRHVQILLLEKNARVGKKLLATGNGRCNLANRYACADKYEQSAVFVAPALERFGGEETQAFFRALGLLCREEEEGRVYPCSGQASSVLDVLRFEAQRLSVQILGDTPVSSCRQTKNGRFLLNQQIEADAVILAAGGQAAPAQGSDGSGFTLLRALGHRITPLYPALSALTSPAPFFRSLKGIRVRGRIALMIGERSVGMQSGELQFTDNGISGIAAMQLSRFAAQAAGRETVTAHLNLAPDYSREELNRFLLDLAEHDPGLPLESFLLGIVPKRLGQVLCAQAGCTPPAMPVGGLDERAVARIAGLLHDWAVPVSGVKGFSAAQVTCGGADTAEFVSGTLESKKIPGLFACGEILDVDGPCGGYNLQWAWSSGRLAGQSCALSLLEGGE